MPTRNTHYKTSDDWVIYDGYIIDPLSYIDATSLSIFLAGLDEAMLVQICRQTNFANKFCQPIIGINCAVSGSRARIMEFSFPRTFAPKNESTIGGTFAPWYFRSL